MSNKNIERLYKSGQQESTPLALDNLILAQAKNSCNQKNTTKKRHWMYSISTAAVVIMSFSIIFNLQHENETIINENLINETIKNETVKGQTMITQPNVLDLQSTENSSLNKSISTNNNAKKTKVIAQPLAELLVTEIEPSTQETSIKSGFADNLSSDTISKETKRRNTAYKLDMDLTLQLKQLDKLIEGEQQQQAKILLKELKQFYPNYDFSKQEELLKSNN